MITINQPFGQIDSLNQIRYPSEMDSVVREEFGQYKAQGYFKDEDGPLSLKTLVSAMQINSTLIFFCLVEHDFIETEDVGAGKVRYKPTQALADYIDNPRGLYVKCATKYLSDQIKRYCPGASSSRQSVRKIMDSLANVLGMVKNTKSMFQRWNCCEYVAFDMAKALAAQRTLEAMYWETRGKLEKEGKTIVELPSHMFKLTKETFQWVFSIRFNSRSDVDQELMEAPEEDRQSNFFGRLRDEISSLQDKINQSTLEFSMAHFLGLCEAEISKLLKGIDQNSKRIEVLSKQISRDTRNMGICWGIGGNGAAM